MVLLDKWRQPGPNAMNAVPPGLSSAPNADCNPFGARANPCEQLDSAR